MSMIELGFRLFISFLTLFFLTRILGRKEISQMTFFNFISAISIGTISASLAIDSSLKISHGILALFAWCAFTLVLAFLNIKSNKIRKLIVGNPVIVIRKGQVMEGSLRKTRLDITSLKALLRKKNVFSIADVDYAIFETDGTLSVMKKPLNQTVTKKDVNIKQPTRPTVFTFPLTIISDGKLIDEAIQKLNVNKKWLNHQLEIAGVNTLEDVFYAEVQQDGTLYVDKRNDALV